MVLGIHSYTSRKLGVLGSFQTISSPVVYAMVKVVGPNVPTLANRLLLSGQPSGHGQQ